MAADRPADPSSVAWRPSSFLIQTPRAVDVIGDEPDLAVIERFAQRGAPLWSALKRVTRKHKKLLWAPLRWRAMGTTRSIPLLFCLSLLLITSLPLSAAQSCEPFAGSPEYCVGIVNYPVYIPPGLDQANLSALVLQQLAPDTIPILQGFSASCLPHIIGVRKQLLRLFHLRLYADGLRQRIQIV